MAEALRTHAVEKGVAPASLDILAFGGAGPSHAWSLGRALGVSRIHFPAGAGVYSAFGLLTAPPTADFVRADRRRLDSDLDLAAVHALFDDGFAEARSVLAAAHVDETVVTVDHLADVRYFGQGSQLTVTVDKAFLESGDPTALVAAFEDAHRARFGRILPGVPVEVVNWRGRLRTPAPTVAPPQQQAGESGGRREIMIYVGREEGHRPATLIPRRTLRPAEPVTGPAIVQEDECAIYVGPGATAVLDDHGNISMELTR
jgi:N-methylhydantoinase A